MGALAFCAALPVAMAAALVLALALGGSAQLVAAVRVEAMLDVGERLRESDGVALDVAELRRSKPPALGAGAGAASLLLVAVLLLEAERDGGGAAAMLDPAAASSPACPKLRVA